MNILRSETKLCLCCDAVHELKIVSVMEYTPFEYEAEYTYCDRAGVLYADEDQMRRNSESYSKHDPHSN